MPLQKPSVRVSWRGEESLEQILTAMENGERILVTLPAGFHHAVTARLSGGSPITGRVEATSAAALDSLALIQGLQELALLRGPAERTGMAVLVRTPPPQIVLYPEPMDDEGAGHASRTAAAMAV
jgi:hypothetical protein